MHFQVTTKWKGKHRDFPYAPCPHTCTASPIINIIGQSGTFVTKAQPTSTHRNHPQALVCFRAHSWCLDKITMTWVHHDNVAQSIFDALKVLCALPSFVGGSACVTRIRGKPSVWKPLLVLSTTNLLVGTTWTDWTTSPSPAGLISVFLTVLSNFQFPVFGKIFNQL